MTTERRPIIKNNVLTAAVETWEIPAADILEGQPQLQWTRFQISADKRFVQGIVHCTPGAYRWTFHHGETMVILEGRGTVTMDGGEEVSFGPGDMLHIPRGESTWVVIETMRQTYHTDRHESLED